MRIKRKLFAILIMICMTAGVLYGSTFEINSEEENAILPMLDMKETIYFWYSDESMTDYLSSAAVAFGEKHDVRVIPRLASQSEYLEAINEASIHSEQIPDVFLISNDSLGKAYLAGLASEVLDSGNILNNGHFPQSALSAVTYRDKYVAYPFFYETSVLVYNETYLEEWARQQAEREVVLADEEAGVEGTEEGGLLDEEAVAARALEFLSEAIPKTVDDILRIADTFDVPMGVEGVMKWDVSDIFHNYWFTGNYMIAGGENGDDERNININNVQTINCLEVYKALNQFFYIESDTVTYESAVQDFFDGKLVFTIATTDVVRRLEEVNEEVNKEINEEENEEINEDIKEEDLKNRFVLTVLPDVSEELNSRGMSVTTGIVVNGYTEHRETANAFAAFLAGEYFQSLYERTGKVSANLAANTDNEAIQVFMEEYSGSVPIPKMLETSNYWIQLEILFSKVWNGADAATLVKELSDQILSQVGVSGY